MKTTHFYPLLLFLLAGFFSGCSAYLNQPMRTQAARLGEDTKVTPLLRSLPPPREKIVVAIYNFRDQTGQYKPSEVGASWSTAVTQGATSILIRAVEDSGWFIPIERENVGNLLNERKIIRSSRAQFQKEEPGQPLLRPLLYAGLILEGGIVSYDANIITGGAGLRYFGAGGSGQYRQDRVTVYLRAISTTTGKILKTVYTSKTLLSQSIDGGLFRFVNFKRLLEVETGFTQNEPAEMAVTEAIEKAVYSLIVEGLIDDIWDIKPREESAALALVRSYAAEKEQMKNTDLYFREYLTTETVGSVSLNGTALLYEGDYPESVIQPGAEIGLQYALTPLLGLSLHAGYSKLATAERRYEERIGYLDLNLRTRLLPQDKFSPYAFGGGGLLFDQGDNPSALLFASPYFKVNLGLGFEYKVTDFLGIDLAFDQNYLLDDGIDEISQGKYNDYFWRTRLGVKFYLNR